MCGNSGFGYCASAFRSFPNVAIIFSTKFMKRVGTHFVFGAVSIVILELLLNSSTVFGAPEFNAKSAKAGKSSEKQSGNRIGLVAAYSGEWLLENGKQKRAVKRRGFTVYENERPIRTSKDGSLTVVCVNNTTAVCPGNHKIGEPFLLNELEQVDDWWTRLLPFVSNYGGWIFPASRNIDSAINLHDAVVCAPSANQELNFGAVMTGLPDGSYRVDFSNLVDGKPATNVELVVVKSGDSALAKVAGKRSAQDLRPGIFSFKILSGPASSNTDWASIDLAYVEIADSSRFDSDKANLDMMLQKTAAWTDRDRSKIRIDMIRALLTAQSTAPSKDYPKTGAK